MKKIASLVVLFGISITCFSPFSFAGGNDQDIVKLRKKVFKDGILVEIVRALDTRSIEKSLALSGVIQTSGQFRIAKKEYYRRYGMVPMTESDLPGDDQDKKRRFASIGSGRMYQIGNLILSDVAETAMSHEEATHYCGDQGGILPTRMEWWDTIRPAIRPKGIFNPRLISSFEAKEQLWLKELAADNPNEASIGCVLGTDEILPMPRTLRLPVYCLFSE